MPKLFADLHIHPTLYSYNRMRNHPEEKDGDRFHPWYDQPTSTQALDRGDRGATYTQASVARLVHGRCRLAFASITPIEKGFFVGDVEGETETPWAAEALKLVSGATAVRSIGHLIRRDSDSALGEVTRILRNRGPLRRLLQRTFLKYGMPRIRHFFSDDFDYWDEFQREYEFLASRSGVESTGTVDLGGGATIEISGTYRMVRTTEELRSTVEDSDEVAIIHTIEGGHTFSIAPDQKPVSEALMFERIDALKSLEFPLFFLTLAHHFDNGICGHAHSLIDVGQHVMNQRPRMHDGFEPGLGMRVLRKLLALDEELADTGERRILIDVKHLSPQSRKELYEEVVRPVNTSGSAPSIPVLASHAGFSGVPTLDEQIADADHESDHWHRGPYYAWGINLSHEDVRMIHDSRGVIGLCFDQRICGVKPKESVPAQSWIHPMLAQILGIVDVIWLDDGLSRDEKLRAWDMVGIGSDFDGMIDPVTAYPTVSHFDQWALDLHSQLESLKHTRGIAEIGVDELVEKIAWRNAYEFALRHFDLACR